MAEAPVTWIPWNLVAKNMHGHELLHKKILDNIRKLERHLAHFAADAVHLHIILERFPDNHCFTASLTLRVPSNILHSEKKGDDVIKTFDDGVRALIRQLEGLKSRLRREPLWKHTERRTKLHEGKAAAFAPEPLPPGTGPQTPGQIARDLFARHYEAMLRHVRRHLGDDASVGDFPGSKLDARDIIGEAARKVEASADRKPEGMDWMVWFYRLIHEELNRQRKSLKEQEAEDISTEASATQAQPDQPGPQPLEELMEDKIEPEVIRDEDVIANAEAIPPDEALEQEETIEQIEQDVKTWRRPEREIFDLFYHEGFEPDEIALVTSRPLDEVRQILGRLRKRVRQALVSATPSQGL